MPGVKQADRKNNKLESIEATLWRSADKLRKNMDAAEYKHVVLGLIFLKYISDAFEVLHSKLVNGKGEYEGADPEDPNEYTAEKVFFVPPIARWKPISANARKTEILLDNGKKVDIGGYVDEAMEAIERQNTSLRGVLPRVYARQNLDRASLGGLIDLVGTIALGTEQAQSKDVLGQVYEYFLGQFALALSDEIAFFQAVRARLLKFEGEGDSGDKKSYETAIRQIVNQAVASTEVVDIFDAAGIKKPDISLLSEEFLQDVKDMKHKNLGIELLKKILNDEIRVRLKFNITEGKSLLAMLEASIKKYQNNLLTTAEIIEELLAIARQIRTVDGLAEKLKLTKDEFAFYTALEVNDSAVKILGDETLKNIAREIAEKVRKNATIDWAMKESARAKLMVIVRRTLNKYGYPPDKQQKAIDTVLKQAEVLADYWVEQ